MARVVAIEFFMRIPAYNAVCCDWRRGFWVVEMERHDDAGSVVDCGH